MARDFVSRHGKATIPEPARSFLGKHLQDSDWAQIDAEITANQQRHWPCPRPVQSQRWNQQQFQQMMSGWNETVKNLEKPKP